jgi:hypothetical protein
MKKILTALFLFVALLPYEAVLGYDDLTTHPDLTEIAVKNSILSNNLSQKLGPEFAKNYESSINGKQVIEWIKDGSIAEDAEMCRRGNHFHDPLKSWETSYNSDLWWPEPGCVALGWFSRYSTVTWATGFLAPPSAGQKASYSITSV